MSGLLNKISKLPRTVNVLSVWDIDDTLFHSPNTHIYVINKNKIVRKLTTTEYNTYKPKPGETFDFSEFRDAKLFFHTAQPLGANIAQAKRALESKNSMLLALTARADFNNKGLFLQTFKKYGLNMSTNLSHVARSGNLGLSTAAGKKKVLEDALNTGKFTEVHMFDDDKNNLIAFLSLQKTFKDIVFKSYLVSNGRIVKFR